MLRRPPISTLFPTRRSSDLGRPTITSPTSRFTSSAAGAVKASDAGCSINSSSSHERSADRKSTCLNSSHVRISYAVFCLKKKKKENKEEHIINTARLEQQNH